MSFRNTTDPLPYVMLGFVPSIQSNRHSIMPTQFYVYILASKRNGTLYTGMTNDLVRRIWEHKEALVPGFTKTYSVKTLVYFECFDDPASAIQREKTMKRWSRAWKINAIEKDNPTWADLYDGVSS